MAANLLDAKRAFGLVDLFLYLLRDVVALTLTLELEDNGLLAFDQWGERLIPNHDEIKESKVSFLIPRAEGSQLLNRWPGANEGDGSIIEGADDAGRAIRRWFATCWEPGPRH